MAEPRSGALQLSVVLATYRRADTLRRTLQHLAAQDLPASLFEVIVIDDGSPDDTAAVVESMRSQLGAALSYLRHDNHGPGYTHNRGIAAARAPLLLLLADDIFLAPGALRCHLEHHRCHPQAEVVLMGKIVQSPALDQTVFLRTWDPFKFIEVDGLDELPVCRFGAPNVSIKREFLLRHGGFLEHRGRGGAAAFEDVELGYRLHDHGMKLHYARGALGHHHHVVTLDQAEARWYERGLNYGEFRRHAPHSELTVYFHVLDRHSWREYRTVLRGANPFHGRERRFSWHLLRHGVRLLLLNRLTAPWLWRPIFDRAERWRWLGALMRAPLYRAYLYYHFIRGVEDARRIFAQASNG